MLPTDPFRYASLCGGNDEWQGVAGCDAWPNSGEIDVMEHVGYEPRLVHGTVHTRAYFHGNGQQQKGSVVTPLDEGRFHIYSVEWTPEVIHLYRDGSLYFSYHNRGEDWQAWPFDHPYHLVLNLAIGGTWGRAGGAIDESVFPVRMEVDYVRVYKPAPA